MIISLPKFLQRHHFLQRGTASGETIFEVIYSQPAIQNNPMPFVKKFWS